MMMESRIPKSLEHLIVSPDDVLKCVPRSGVVAFAGMAGMGLVKDIPEALSKIGGDIHLTVLTGGTTTEVFEKSLSTIQINRRYPVVSGKGSREMANKGTLHVFDYWLSEYSRLIRRRDIPKAKKIDVAFIESTGIREDGIVPSLSVDAVPAMVENAEKIVIEVNLSKPVLYGLHDIIIPSDREPIPIKNVTDRIGEPVIRCKMDKIAGILLTNKPETGAGAYKGVGKVELSIAQHVVEILEAVVGFNGRGDFYTLQPGAGPLASALLKKLSFNRVLIWSEAITVDWVDSIGDKVDAISTSCVYALQGQETMLEKAYEELPNLSNNLVLRPYEITNRAELIARMNLISIQQAIEVDIYGNTNITHVGGDIYNGVGGSGDFSRNALFTILALPSVTSDERYSRIVPICSHVDIPEHDIDFLVTEKGWVDLRGLSPRERAELIIENCAHEKFRDMLSDYFEKACRIGGHEPVSWKDAVEFREKLAK